MTATLFEILINVLFGAGMAAGIFVVFKPGKPKFFRCLSGDAADE
jgi:hypothetical protein